MENIIKLDKNKFILGKLIGKIEFNEINEYLFGVLIEKINEDSLLILKDKIVLLNIQIPSSKKLKNIKREKGIKINLKNKGSKIKEKIKEMPINTENQIKEQNELNLEINLIQITSFQLKLSKKELNEKILTSHSVCK